jgi:hypothetical protein
MQIMLQYKSSSAILNKAKEPIMEKLEYVRLNLKNTAKDAEVSFRTKLSTRTLSNIRKPNSKPHTSTIEALHAYFKRREGK